MDFCEEFCHLQSEDNMLRPGGFASFLEENIVSKKTSEPYFYLSTKYLWSIHWESNFTNLNKYFAKPEP